MKNVTFISAIVMSAVAITGTSVLAAGPGGREPVSFQELDADGDGQVTQQEMEAHRTARFTEADTNGDGMLSQKKCRLPPRRKPAIGLPGCSKTTTRTKMASSAR